jgi:hypothetical protein
MPRAAAAGCATSSVGRHRRVATMGGTCRASTGSRKPGSLVRGRRRACHEVLNFMMAVRKVRKSHCGTISVSSSYGAALCTSARTTERHRKADTSTPQVKSSQRERPAPAPAMKTAAHEPSELSESSVIGMARISSDVTCKGHSRAVRWGADGGARANHRLGRARPLHQLHSTESSLLYPVHPTHSAVM